MYVGNILLNFKSDMEHPEHMENQKTKIETDYI